MNALIVILLIIHVIVCVLLLLIVLMQRPRSEGLGTAFGSAVTDTLFGSSTGNVLTKITTWLGIIFFATTLSLAYLYSHQRTKGTGIAEEIKKEEAAVQPTPDVPSGEAATPAEGSEAAPATEGANAAAPTNAAPPAAPAAKSKPAPAK
jgi:preprotein translocase subunit SecG